MSVTDTGPLDWRISIVDKQGRPSPEFQRRWNANRSNTTTIEEEIVVLEEEIDALVIPTAANPTATGGNVAVNGVATTFMRSDAAPAIQLGSDSVFGLLKVDGTSITASSGVISAAPSDTAFAPLTTGAEPIVLVSDGLGQCIMVPI